MKMPTIVFLMCKCGANVVGSFAKYLAYGTGTPKDFDLIVPPEKWYVVSLLIPKNARLNGHGGLKFRDKDDSIIDVWPCSIEQHLRQCSTGTRRNDCVVDVINRKVFSISDLETCRKIK